MILYHGTTKNAADRILIEGILPRKVSRAPGTYVNRKDVESVPSLVYLCTHTPAYHAFQAVNELDDEAAEAAEMAIVRVEVPIDALMPDEDFLREIRKVREPRQPWKYKRLTKDSLKYMGTASTRRIGPDQLRGVVTVQKNGKILWMMGGWRINPYLPAYAGYPQERDHAQYRIVTELAFKLGSAEAAIREYMRRMESADTERRLAALHRSLER